MIGEARSLAAEWSLVNHQAMEGHLTRAYVKTMHDSLRQQLETAAKSLTQPDSSYGREISALLREPPDAAPEQLSRHAERLRRIESSLESA
jgi:hypothetical protein